MPVARATVLILSTDRAFARELTAHWPADPNPPEFTVLEEGLFRDLAGSHYDLAIAEVSSPDSRTALNQALAAIGKPCILVHSDSSRAFSGEKYSNAEGMMIELRGDLGGNDERWPSIAGLLGREILRRCQAEARAHDAEARCAAANAEATLGRYMAEMRHNVNNALTSILGNTELLALEPGLPANVLAEADTILNMALRLHEVFQRFSSIEKELSVAARESGKKPVHVRAASHGN